jgi:rare lipoprotein A
VNARRALAAPLALAMVAGLAGCLSAPQRPESAPISTVPPVLSAPAMPDSVPDAVPRIEPRAQHGNPPFYDVFGKRYYVLSSSVGYWERGVASWYGPGFHKVRTSIGEPYDMYAMTAAHKTLPLPAYVRVTNLQNGRSVVVRVNDRGPFVGNRIIDLSYTAAAKLDMLRNGTAMVDVRSIDPMAPPVFTASTSGAPASTSGAPASTPTLTASTSPAAPAGAGPAVAAPAAAALTVEPFSDASPATPQPPIPRPASTAVAAAPSAVAAGAAPVAADAQSSAAGTSFTRSPLFIQAGAFSDPANAERLAEKLRGGSLGKVFVRDDVIAGRRMYRVRIGPVPNVADFDRVVAALERAGINDAHLALD